ncbi:MAG TPA: toll/interleukin-1 receptor domain-containing protein [Pyrinomonadaceae bacterium]|nr:toll/interleukin-1 receptor domain-containing protein [Pyrinomonadaceae bacterium]
MPPVKVFLSHSDRDRKFVTGLAKVLQRHGVQVWYSRTSIKAARQWYEEIGAALNKCNWFLVVLTPDALKSDWVSDEVVYATVTRRYKGRIIPLVYKPSKYKKKFWTLANIEAVDFTTKGAKRYRDLLSLWKIEYQPRRK